MTPKSRSSGPGRMAFKGGNHREAPPGRWGGGADKEHVAVDGVVGDDHGAQVLVAPLLDTGATNVLERHGVAHCLDDLNEAALADFSC